MDAGPGRPLTVDADVHQSLPDLTPHLPRHWRERWAQTGLGVGTGYHNPRGVLRQDTLPPDGGPPASDPLFLLSDHLDRYAIDYAVLTGPFVLPLGHDPDYLDAVARAVNDATAAGWLGVSRRFRGSVLVNADDPEAAVAEIERCGDRESVVQVLMATTTREPCGRRRYHPIYRAAAERGLPVALHPGAEGAGGAAPPTPVGYPSRYLEWHSLLPLTAMAQLASLLCEGVFEAFPDLRVVLVEGGVSWLPSLLWRLDKNYKALRDTTPWLRRLPSEYVAEHVRLTSQPIEEPPHPQQLEQVLAMVDAGRTLMFSSDYPHWDNDNPEVLFRRVDPAVRARIMGGTAAELYGLDGPPPPEQLPPHRSGGAADVLQPTGYHE
ncbi:amidohydrolase [Desertihabitans brevis]|uniref:Amidohydrolase n=1 Tax=Desertihabitans brevis TaxID=2268447 RepID=A0A367YUD2_9ACTN|nr:amidohydrolase family protein [Desertihabitans brevis]RCK69367.1 amidohydrolase [Desertihabitans brevis]